MKLSTISKKQLEKEIKRREAKDLYCVFLSPGTLFSETTSIKIKTVNLRSLCKRALNVKERYGAKPYGFIIQNGNGKYLTGNYFINGRVIRYDDIPENADNRILRSNMRYNRHPLAIETRNSYRHTAIFEERDVNLDKDGKVLDDGGSREFCEYRKQKIQHWEDNDFKD